MHSKLQNGTKLRQGVVFPDLPRPFGASRGPIGSPKIHQESTFCSEMHSKRVFFADFCADNRFTRFFSRFCINFSRKNNQNLMRKWMHFFTASLAFSNMATLTKHRILRYESYFFIFLIFVFFFLKSIKKWLQNSSHTLSLKKHRKVVPGGPFWAPRWCRIYVGETKHLENRSKKSFFDRLVVRTFF